ncbi:MAG: lysine exporter LysO family protein [Alistipes sp.]
MRGSLIIIGFFIVGCVVGLYDLLPFSPMEMSLSTYVLYALMFCVGITLGHDTTILQQIRTLNPRLALLPLMTIIGTLLGSMVAVLFLQSLTVTDGLAVGAGFGYYSLSSIFIADFKGVELGTIGLLTNVLREIFTLLFAPVVAKYCGPLAAISIGGATTFDTTLPIITQSVGKEYVVVSMFHGCLLDFSVPFLVTLFCTI